MSDHEAWLAAIKDSFVPCPGCGEICPAGGCDDRDCLHSRIDALLADLAAEADSLDRLAAAQRETAKGGGLALAWRTRCSATAHEHDAAAIRRILAKHGGAP